MTCFPCENLAKNNKINVLIIEPGQTILRNQKPQIQTQNLKFSAPFKTEQKQINDLNQNVIPSKQNVFFDGITPQGLNSDLIINGDFLFESGNFEHWDVVAASYSGLSTVGAILDPISGYSIKQDVLGDPLKYYKVTFKATVQLPDTSAEIDGYIRIQIVDKVSGDIILDKTEYVNNKVTPRYYNITNISQAEVRFYAIGRSVSLLGVSICDGPLMYSDRVNNVILYDFTHSYDGWTEKQIVPEFASKHQDFENADGVALSPSNTDFKLQSENLRFSFYIGFINFHSKSYERRKKSVAKKRLVDRRTRFYKVNHCQDRIGRNDQMGWHCIYDQ